MAGRWPACRGAHVARHIAVVPQETHPAFDYTALEMVLMGRHPHLGPFQLEGPADLAIAHEALDATGTAHLAERPYMTLSGGEKQRVVIASALAQSPEVLLLDEPTASLDLGYQLEIGLLLQRLNHERGGDDGAGDPRSEPRGVALRHARPDARRPRAGLRATQPTCSRRRRCASSTTSRPTSAYTSSPGT